MDADKKSVEGGNKMKKFEVGERVQFIYAGKLRTGGIKKFTQGKGEVYAHIEVDDTQACVRVTTDNIAKLDQPEQQSEKIKKINEIMLELINRKHMDILSDDDITRMLIEALDIINTLDEPKPVVVPKFVAECIREYELVLSDGYSTKDTVLDNIIQDWALGGIDSDFSDWVDDNLITLIDAVRNGYVVEEEKKWIVSTTVSGRDFDPFYFKGFDSSDKPFAFSQELFQSDAYKFTEKEKADAVAVLIGGTVEEVEAE